MTRKITCPAAVLLCLATFTVNAGTAAAERRPYETKKDHCARLKQDHDDAVRRMKDPGLGRAEQFQAAKDDEKAINEAKAAGCKWSKGIPRHAADSGTLPDQPLTRDDGSAGGGGGPTQSRNPYASPDDVPSFATQG